MNKRQLLGKGHQFELTQTHLDLLAALNVREDFDHYGTPVPLIDDKRPFGNKDSIGTILEKLGHKQVEDRWGDKFWTNEQAELAKQYLAELTPALQIVLSNLTICRPGVYAKDSEYGQSWSRLS